MFYFCNSRSAYRNSDALISMYAAILAVRNGMFVWYQQITNCSINIKTCTSLLSPHNVLDNNFFLAWFRMQLVQPLSLRLGRLSWLGNRRKWKRGFSTTIINSKKVENSLPGATPEDWKWGQNSTFRPFRVPKIPSSWPIGLILGSKWPPESGDS